MSLCLSPDVGNSKFEALSPPGPSNTRLFVEIPRWEDHSREDGSKYTTYEVVVRCKGQKWKLDKRYSDFVALRESVKGLRQCIEEFDFPRKSKFNTFSNWTKERRRTGFEDFMMLLLGFTVRPPEVDRFLDVERNLNIRSTGGTIDDNISAMTSMKISSSKPSPISNSSSSISPVPRSVQSSSSHSRKLRINEYSPCMKDEVGLTKCIPKFPPLANPNLTPRNFNGMDVGGFRDGIPARNINKSLKYSERSIFDIFMVGLTVSVFIGVVIYSVWWISGVLGMLSLTIGLVIGIVADRKESIARFFARKSHS